MRLRVPLTIMATLAAAIACVGSGVECFDTLSCPDAVGGSGGSAGGESGAAGAEDKGGSGGASGGLAGTGGELAGAGAGGTDPCDGACGSPTPLCDEGSGECVECLGAEDCSSPTVLCEAHTCVECIGNGDCTDPAASLCLDGLCASCEVDDDCEHLASTTLCDTESATCVECRTDDETPCSGNSCNPATHECTSTPIGSLGTCAACVADSECAGGGTADPTARCVPMEFDGTARPDGYCLRRTSKTCSRPYGVTLSAVSLSGAASESYCGVDQATTTCEAVLDMAASATCSVPADCGDGEGGLCETVGGVADTCTIPCSVANQCPTVLSCDVFCK